MAATIARCFRAPRKDVTPYFDMGGRQLFLIAVSRPFGDLVDEVVRSLRDAATVSVSAENCHSSFRKTESFKYLLSAIPMESNPA